MGYLDALVTLNHCYADKTTGYSHDCGHHAQLQSDFDRIREATKDKVSTPTHLDNASVIALGDYYPDMWIWNTNESQAFDNAVNTAVTMLVNNVSLEKEDIISRAW